MNDNIWFELADCVGDALANRWLAKRSRSGKRLTAKPPSANENPSLPSSPATNAGSPGELDEPIKPSDPDEGI